MQQISAEFPSKSSRSPENGTRQLSANFKQFPRVSNNPRFAITPETMAMGSDNPSPTRVQPVQPETTIVDMESSTPSKVLTTKHESSASFQTSHPNTPTNSWGPLKAVNIDRRAPFYANSSTELMAHITSPNTTPNTLLQQRKFERTISSDCPHFNSMTAGNNNFMQNLKCAGELGTLNNQLLTMTNASPHVNCAFFQNVTSVPEMPTSFQEQHPQKCRSGSDACADQSATLNFKIVSDVFAKRIEDIDTNAAGDKDLKIFTYQEWVETLTNITQSFFTNMEDLEREVADRLELMQKRANCRHSQDSELMKCHKDIHSLLEYIRNARENGKWDLRDLNLETITMADLDSLTIEDNGENELQSFNDADRVHRNKLYANMKALAQEVAEKHDEIRELKRQVICLEDEIQKAQKKIQLKDDVIKELRNDLKCANNKISSNPSLDPNLSMPPINFESQTSRSANTQITDNTFTESFQGENGSQFDSLSHTEHEEQEKIKLLQEEISQLFEISHDVDKQKVQLQSKKIMRIIEKKESEKADAYRKLDFIRRQLVDLESESSEGKSDCDSGFYSKSENDQYVKLLDAVRQRLRRRNETISDLKKTVQKLELEKNELSSSLGIEKSFSKRNSDILKEVADLLSEMKGKQFSYTEMYTASSNKMNPFCEAIMGIHKEFQEKETELLHAVAKKNKENEELSQILLKHEKEFNREKAIHTNLNDFGDTDNTPAKLLHFTSAPPLSATPATTVTGPSTTSSAGQQSDNITSLHGFVDI